MEVLLVVIGAVLGLILTVLFSEPLASLVVRLAGPLSILPTNRTVKGEWFAYYEVIPDGLPPLRPGEPINAGRVERIKFSKIGAAVVGQNMRDSRSYFLRLRMESDCILTGTWRDVSGGRYHFGAVQLVWDYSGDHMLGKYVGRDRHNDVNWGPWAFARTEAGLQPVIDEWRRTAQISPEVRSIPDSGSQSKQLDSPIQTGDDQSA